MNSQTLQKILVVDDEPDINTIAKISLESFGKYSVETCSSGLEALKKAEWFEPNLILLDIMMPFMDGEETLKKLKRNPKTSDIPVVFVTAKIFTRDISKYKELGAVDVIPKPFDPVSLPSQVREIWTDFYHRQNAELEILEKIAELKVEFMKAFPERLSLLRTSWRLYLEDQSEQRLRDVYAAVHKITGVSGTIQLTDIYECSVEMERMLSEELEAKRYHLSMDIKKVVFDRISKLGSFVS